MTIASHVFLLLFLPFTIALYYIAFRSSRLKMFFLLAVSYAFYALADLKFLPLLIGLSFFTFLLAKRRMTGLGIILNLGTLILFKYWNFGMDTFNSLMKVLEMESAAKLVQVALPLGISFYIFKHISYLLDIQRQRYQPATDFWTFATYSAYFPQISAGPLSNYQGTSVQFSNLPNRLNSEQAYTGLMYISLGLTKKVLIADSLATFLGSTFNTIEGFAGLLPAWYLVVAFSMRLYFDFSGYTDMVLGVSILFGISLPQNFNNPYLAGNPASFWERWHISLSNWFNYYVFSPLSRSLLRKWGPQGREQAQYTANFATMALVGIWHGTGWSFILWGVYHGLLLNINAWWKRKSRPFHPWIGSSLFILSLLLGWALFMSPDVDYLRHLFLQLFGFGGLGERTVIQGLLTNTTMPALAAGIALAVSGVSEASNLLNASRGRSGWHALIWGVLAALCLLLLGEQIQFLYVQF